MSRATKDHASALRIPGVSALADLFRRIADLRVGRVPVGLGLLLPVALALDFFDFADELGGPIGMAISFVLESAFVFGVSGRAGYALGFAGIDLIPGVDIIPFATITVIREMARSRDDAPRAARRGADGPVIDV